MTLVQDWVEDLRIEVPDLLDSTLKRAVIFALQEFCRSSEFLRVTDTINLVDGQSYYDVLVPPNFYIISARSVKLSDARVLRYVTSPCFRVDPNLAVPTSFHINETGVTLNSSRGTTSFEVEVVVQPTRKISVLAFPIVDSYFEAIRSGALARLLRMPNKPWSHAGYSSIHSFIFEKGIIQARREARDDRSRPSQSLRFNPDFMW